MSSHIRQLQSLINNSIDKLENICESTGTPVPDLYAPFSPESEAFRANPDAAEAANIISAAALQLEAIVSPPHVSLYHVVAGHFRSAALRITLLTLLKGLHVNDIASKNGQDPRKLARFLRYLANNHIYREITPDVFANTRISSMLDTLKPSQDVIAHPETKYENTPGMAALAGHHLDECFKASVYAWETLSDPTTVKSGEPTAAPLARAFNIQQTYYDFLARDEFRSRRLNVGMRGVQAMQPVDAILKAYDWKKLPAGSVIVDVGGGVGSDSLVLVREFPTLDIIVQDLPPVIEDAKKFWQKNLPNGKVTLEVQDFFTPQPADRKVSVFFLKHILHNWSDEYCVKLLTQLRAAAEKNTKLLLVEYLLPFACHDTNSDDALDIPGSVPHEAPAPLLANYGAVNQMGYNADMVMFFVFNSQNRTIRHINELLLSTGWKVKQVYRQDGDSTSLQLVEAIPVDDPFKV
ncbi:hypothetical protein C0995_007424 [Termitomyces sp. Mi166|nr:hypothetical protein C0995_007424 [Termitomyces sp. Mi166\